MKLLGAIPPVLALALVVGVASASNDTLADYTYVLTVGVNNQSGSALASFPVAVRMQPDNLTTDFIQADADDWRPADGGGVALDGVAQGMTSGNQTWWFNVPAQGSGAVASYYFHMGNATAARDQNFIFDGTTDTVTVTDAASLDITDDVTIQADLTIGTWPGSTTWVFEKDNAYGIGLGNSGGSNAVYGYFGIPSPRTFTLVPDAAGLAENFPNEAGCANGSHQDCLASNDGETSTISGNQGGVPVTDWVNVSAYSGPVDAVVSTVEVTCATVGTTSAMHVGVRLGSTNALRQSVGAGNDCSTTTAFSRPGGGSWTVTDLATVQLYVIADDNGSGSTERFQYAAIVVTMVGVELVATTDDNGAALLTNTEYTIEFNYDQTGSPQAQLEVNASVRSSGTGGGAAVPTNSNNLILGSFDGLADSAQVGDTSVGSPTWQAQLEYEPDQMAETQQGNSANSWVWLGTVDDQSAGGTNDGAYSLTRDMTNITVWTHNFLNKTATVSVAAPVTVDTLGPVAPAVEATKTSETFPFRSLVTNVIDDPNFNISSLAAWFLLFAILGVGLSVLLWKLFGSNLFAAMGLPAMLWVGWLVGSPIPWWIPVIISLAVFGLATGGKKLASA